MMRGFRKLALTVVTFVALAGCFMNRYAVGTGADINREPDYKQWTGHFIAGLVGGSDQLSINNICPSGNAVIEDVRSFVNMLIGGLTGNIYTPSTISVWCGDGSKAEVTVQPEDLRAAVLMNPERYLAFVRVHAPESVRELQAAIEIAAHTPVLATQASTPVRAAAGR
jgi:hypothetical protein